MIGNARTRYRRDLVRNYRAYLSPLVTRASPLLLDVCAAWEVDLAGILHSLRPPAGWPYPRPARGSFWRAPRPPRVSGKGTSGDTVVACLIEEVLEARVRLGDGFACTGGGLLHLWLDNVLPEAIHASLSGRRLGTVVDHPILRMRPYEIVFSRSVGLGTVIKARAPTEPFALPWSAGG